jgi:hypothetical protein
MRICHHLRYVYALLCTIDGILDMDRKKSVTHSSHVVLRHSSLITSQHSPLCSTYHKPYAALHVL